MAGAALTQKEIDMLINDINNNTPISINIDEKTVKNYDFKRPSKINREQLRTLELIFENYSKLASSYLTSYIRLPVQMEVVSAEQINFKEYYNTMSKTILLSLIELYPLQGTIFMQIDNSIGDIILDRMLGGKGIAIKRKYDFSDIEKVLLEKTMSKLSEYLKEPFEDFIKLEPKLIRLETNSQLNYILSPNDVLFLVNIKININGQEGFIYFCIPYLVVESIMNRLNSKYKFSNKNKNNATAIEQKSLESIYVPMTATLFKTYISIQDLMSLNIGDVIVSDSYTNQDPLMMAGTIPKFNCSPCLIKNHNGVLIKSIINKQEE